MPCSPRPAGRSSHSTSTGRSRPSSTTPTRPAPTPRRTADPEGVLEVLRGPLAELAGRHGLIVEPGRMVLEVRPPGIDKGVALADYVRRSSASAVLYAGDDLGDLAAFDGVERLRAEGVPGVLVCSGSNEVTGLAARADLVVDGPTGVVGLLDALARQLSQSASS